MNPDMSRARLVVVHLLVLSLLATLVARLWFLQILTGDEAQRLAEQTSIRLIHQAAPRGFIFDRTGEALVRNRTALTVALDVSLLPAAERDQVIPELARVLGISEAHIRAVVDDPRIGHYTPRPIAVDVDKDTVIYIREHQDKFPGVTDLEIPVREYPHESLGAHVIGHIGEISAEELEARREEVGNESTKAYRSGDQIGKIGVERVYEDWLRGISGIEKIAVNVRGERVQSLGTHTPERGLDAVLTIDAEVQRAAEEGLERGIQLARRLTDPDTGKLYEAPAGAVVALDPRDGEILALSSNPTFDPNMFVGRIPPDEYARLNDPDSHFPMMNRAIAEAVPPGSTFKPITAAAAWDATVMAPGTTWHCPGHYRVGNRVFRDWTPDGHGLVGLRRGMAESCDIVFYDAGVKMNAERERIGEHLQTVARHFGYGEITGIDLLGERSGLVPDATWKEERFAWAQPYDRRWFDGDSANLAIGQGFLQVTPLQLAVSYGAFANGGTLYRPRVMKCMAELDVSRPVSPEEACRSGVVPESASPKVLGRVPVPAAALDFISDSMVGTQVDEGTAARAFEGFPLDRVPVAGKTGTAQMKPRQPFSWYAAYAPAHDPEIVVVALVEEGGTGSQIAAPIVRHVMERHFGLPEGNFEAGARAD